MSDSTDVAVEPGFEAEGSKSTVSLVPSTEVRREVWNQARRRKETAEAR